MRHPVITNLYEVFAKYQLNKKITGHYCEVCLSEDYNQYLHQSPLGQLTDKDFIVYLGSVDIIDESCNDFRYFLPRLLEIAYESEDRNSFFFDALWTTIAKSNHKQWPDQEQAALKEFAFAYMNKAKQTGDVKSTEGAIWDLEKAQLITFDHI